MKQDYEYIENHIIIDTSEHDNPYLPISVFIFDEALNGDDWQLANYNKRPSYLYIGTWY